MRIFSIKRAFLAFILGFLLPLGYAYSLHLAEELTGSKPTDLMLMPFGWPRPLWIFLTGRQPYEFDLIVVLTFAALANIVLYGSLVYLALTLVPAFWRKSEPYAAPPPPEGYLAALSDPVGRVEVSREEPRAGVGT